MSAAGWRNVSKREPCIVCKHGDRCRRGADGSAYCWRGGPTPAGFEPATCNGGGHLFQPIRPRTPEPRRATVGPASDKLAAPLDWSAEAERFRVALTPEQRETLAGTLGVRADALDKLGLGWASGDDLRRMHASGAGWAENYPDGAYTFPERDGRGQVVGLSLRATDGRKGSPAGKLGAKRGLIVPATLRERPEPVLIVEGASDVAACDSLGLAAVGRPSNTGGAADLAKLLRGRDSLVVGESDAKESGAWPGRDGAERVATALATAWDADIRWALPPAGTKDVRAWLQSRGAAGLDLRDAEACAAAGRGLLAELEAAATEAEPEPKPSQAEALVRLAKELFRVGLAHGDEPFAVRLDGANVAIMFRGYRDALRSTLSREYRRRTGKTPNAAALADAIVALQGEALECAPEPVCLRVAEHGDGIVLDLGDASGRCVIVRPGGWELADVSPVLFRRSALTAALPEPERGGNVAELRGLLNVSDDSWPLLLGWLVAALLPEIAHPVLMLGGEQGTAKTTGARLAFRCFDPSTAETRSQPTDPEQWALAAAGSWGVLVDNVSAIPGWFSDALCKAATGDGWIRRRLYSDGDLSVQSFRRVIALTSIDPGALRGDLADRLLLLEFEPIPDERRRSESDIDARFADVRPRVLGGLLTLLAGVLAELPRVKLDKLPRMADFARVLAALDAVAGTDALPRYLGQRGTIAGDVLESDPVGAALVKLATDGEWGGTPAELLARIKPEHAGREWPATVQALSGRLKRLTPALRAVGIDVIRERVGHSRTRRITVTKNTVRIVRTPAESALDGTAGNAGEQSDADLRTTADERGRTPNADRPHSDGLGFSPVPVGALGFPTADDADDADDVFGTLSLADDEGEL